MQEERLNNKTRYLKTTKMPFHISHLNQTGIMGFQMDVTDSIKNEKQGEHGDDWALATEIEKTLKVQLEALRIAQKEFPKK